MEKVLATCDLCAHGRLVICALTVEYHMRRCSDVFSVWTLDEEGAIGSWLSTLSPSFLSESGFHCKVGRTMKLTGANALLQGNDLACEPIEG